MRRAENAVVVRRDLARRRPAARAGPSRLVLADPVVAARPADRAVALVATLALAVVDIVLPTVVGVDADRGRVTCR